VFETAVGKVGGYICYDRHFPEGARALGLNGAEMVFIPSATSRGLSEYLWRIEQVSHAVANGACPSEWRHGWKWSLTKTLSKPFASAAMAKSSSSRGPNCSAEAL